MIGVLLGTLSTLAILFVLLRPVFLSPKLWFAGSIVIYAVCLAGVVYNIIHNVPMFTNDKKGGFQWKTSVNIYIYNYLNRVVDNSWDLKEYL